MRKTLAQKWQQELQAQAKLRKRIAAAERQHRALVQERVRLLKVGGPGWATALAKVNVQIERAWEQVRVLLLKLYSRRSPV